MVDTTKIRIPLSHPWRRRDVYFQLFKENEKGIIVGHLNPTKEMLAQMPYLPRLTYIERPSRSGMGKDCSLEAEVSLPKLIFGNNFTELTESDLPIITQKLGKALHLMTAGFFFSTQLEKAEVVKIDFAKNIVFDDFTSVSEVIKILSLADISKVFDVDRTSLRNGGQIMHIHTNSEDIAIYDKVADLKRSAISPKRAIGKDDAMQLSLIDELEKRRGLAVLRFEVRLNGKKKIREELHKLGMDDPLTLESLFKADIAKKILMSRWSNIYDRIPKCDLDDSSSLQLFTNIVREDPATPQNALARLGLVKLLEDIGDARLARNLIEDTYGAHAWSRIKKFGKLPPGRQLKNLQRINDVIAEMKPIRLEYYDINI